jgi:hypothetical protein
MSFLSDPWGLDAGFDARAAQKVATGVPFAAAPVPIKEARLRRRSA